MRISKNTNRKVRRGEVSSVAILVKIRNLQNSANQNFTSHTPRNNSYGWSKLGGVAAFCVSVFFEGIKSVFLRGKRKLPDMGDDSITGFDVAAVADGICVLLRRLLLLVPCCCCCSCPLHSVLWFSAEDVPTTAGPTGGAAPTDIDRRFPGLFSSMLLL